MKYFKDCTTLNEVKKVYRHWAMKLHPDHGGAEADFLELSKQYEETVKRIQNGASGKSSKSSEVEDMDAFKKAVDTALKCEGVVVEQVGSWLWLSGNTYPNKETLKSAGYRWCKKHSQWYFPGQQGKRRPTGLSMEQIKSLYGSQIIGTGKAEDKNSNRLSA